MLRKMSRVIHRKLETAETLEKRIGVGRVILLFGHFLDFLFTLFMYIVLL